MNERPNGLFYNNFLTIVFLSLHIELLRSSFSLFFTDSDKHAMSKIYYDAMTLNA